MVVAGGVAANLRAFPVAAVGGQAEVVHGHEDAALHGLEAVANVGQRARDDDAHRVVEIGLLHLGFDIDWKEYRLVGFVRHFPSLFTPLARTTSPTALRLDGPRRSTLGAGRFRQNFQPFGFCCCALLIASASARSCALPLASFEAIKSCAEMTFADRPFSASKSTSTRFTQHASKCTPGIPGKISIWQGGAPIRKNVPDSRN